MNASDLQTNELQANDLQSFRRAPREITTFDVWFLARILIGASAVMTLATFSYILV